MRRALFLAPLVFRSLAVSASATEEERVVRAMISAAQEDRLADFLHTVDLPRIAAASREQCTPETVLAIGKLLAAPEVVLETQRRGEVSVVRAGKVMALFSFRGLAKTMREPEGRLVISAVDLKWPSDT